MQLKEIIEKVVRPLEGFKNMYFKIINKEMLKNLFESENLVEHLLCDNYFHPEIFKKSIHIFIFMVE